MTKEELRNECSRLFFCKKIEDMYELFDVYSNCCFMLVLNHHNDPVKSTADADGKIVLQMMMTKILHLKKIAEGVTYKAVDGSTLSHIIDPTVLNAFIRNIYETTGMFNLIYRYPQDASEKELIYLLWVHAGLAYRQRFESSMTSEENLQKFKDEKLELDKIKKHVENNALFRRLDEKNKGKIWNRVERKEYLIRVLGQDVIFLNWQALTSTMDVKEKLLENIYTYFSLYAHPSNVSVFQFAGMFKESEKAFISLTMTNLRVAFMLFSIFIADYLTLFPETMKTFDKLSSRDQIVINFYNTLARSDKYSINNIGNILD